MDRVLACLFCLLISGCGGALVLDQTVGEWQRERVRAEHPDRSFCGGVGIDPYLAGGFLVGTIPAGWLLWRSRGFRFMTDDAEPRTESNPSTEIN